LAKIATGVLQRDFRARDVDDHVPTRRQDARRFRIHLPAGAHARCGSFASRGKSLADCADWTSAGSTH
jgi:hypothetical protein